MPRRQITDIEKALFESDERLSNYDTELKEAGALLGGASESKKNALTRITKAKAAIRKDQVLVTQKTKEARSLKTRLAHLRDMKRRRQKVLRDQHYRDTVNPIRKELGLAPLSVRPTERKIK